MGSESLIRSRCGAGEQTASRFSLQQHHRQPQREQHAHDGHAHGALWPYNLSIMGNTPERVAYHNGAIVPESQVLIPLRDAGFLYGYAAFDTERTFAHQLYKLDEHLPLFRSIAVRVP